MRYLIAIFLTLVLIIFAPGAWVYFMQEVEKPVRLIHGVWYSGVKGKPMATERKVYPLMFERCLDQKCEEIRCRVDSRMDRYIASQRLWAEVGY